MPPLDEPAFENPCGIHPEGTIRKEKYMQKTVSAGVGERIQLNKLAKSYRLIEQTGSASDLNIKNGNRSAQCH